MGGYQRWVSEIDRDDKLVFPEDERLVDQEYLRYKYVLNTYLTSTCSTGVYCCVTWSAIQKVDDHQDASMMTIIVWEYAIVYPMWSTSSSEDRSLLDQELINRLNDPVAIHYNSHSAIVSSSLQ